MYRIALCVALLVVLAAPAQGGWDEAWDAYKSRDYATATRECIALAEQADARARVTLGIMVVFGEVVLDEGGPWNHEKLYPKFEKWFFEPDASNKQNLNEAEKWFRNAANQGDTKAWTLLGHIYDSLGVLYYFFGQYAPGGITVVEGGVTHMFGRYRDGHGVPQGLDEAMKLWLKAAEQGEVTAQKSLAFVFGFQNKGTESANWTRKAAEQGDHWAQLHLAASYMHGPKKRQITSVHVVRPCGSAGCQGGRRGTRQGCISSN